MGENTQLKGSKKTLNEAGIFAYSPLSKSAKFNQHLPVRVPIKPKTNGEIDPFFPNDIGNQHGKVQV